MSWRLRAFFISIIFAAFFAALAPRMMMAAETVTPCPAGEKFEVGASGKTKDDGEEVDCDKKDSNGNLVNKNNPMCDGGKKGKGYSDVVFRDNEGQTRELRCSSGSNETPESVMKAGNLPQVPQGGGEVPKEGATKTELPAPAREIFNSNLYDKVPENTKNPFERPNIEENTQKFLEELVKQAQANQPVEESQPLPQKSLFQDFMERIGVSFPGLGETKPLTPVDENGNPIGGSQPVNANYQLPSQSTGFGENPETKNVAQGAECSGFWPCTAEMLRPVADAGKKVWDELFGIKDAEGAPEKRATATVYYPGGCSVGVDPGCSPGSESGRIGSRGNSISRSTPVVAAGHNSGLKFGDVLKITNPITGKSTPAVVGDECSACGSGIDLTPAVYKALGTYRQVNGNLMQVEIVSRGNSWSGGLAQVQSLTEGGTAVAANETVPLPKSRPLSEGGEPLAGVASLPPEPDLSKLTFNNEGWGPGGVAVEPWNVEPPLQGQPEIVVRPEGVGANQHVVEANVEEPRHLPVSEETRQAIIIQVARENPLDENGIPKAGETPSLLPEQQPLVAQTPPPTEAAVTPTPTEPAIPDIDRLTPEQLREIQDKLYQDRLDQADRERIAPLPSSPKPPSEPPIDLAIGALLKGDLDTVKATLGSVFSSKANIESSGVSISPAPTTPKTNDLSQIPPPETAVFKVPSPEALTPLTLADIRNVVAGEPVTPESFGERIANTWKALTEPTPAETPPNEYFSHFAPEPSGQEPPQVLTQPTPKEPPLMAGTEPVKFAEGTPFTTALPADENGIPESLSKDKMAFKERDTTETKTVQPEKEDPAVNAARKAVANLESKIGQLGNTLRNLQNLNDTRRLDPQEDWKKGVAAIDGAQKALTNAKATIAKLEKADIVSPEELSAMKDASGKITAMTSRFSEMKSALSCSLCNTSMVLNNIKPYMGQINGGLSAALQLASNWADAIPARPTATQVTVTTPGQAYSYDIPQMGGAPGVAYTDVLRGVDFGVSAPPTGLALVSEGGEPTAGVASLPPTEPDWLTRIDLNHDFGGSASAYPPPPSGPVSAGTGPTELTNRPEGFGPGGVASYNPYGGSTEPSGQGPSQPPVIGETSPPPEKPAASPVETDWSQIDVNAGRKEAEQTAKPGNSVTVSPREEAGKPSEPGTRSVQASEGVPPVEAQPAAPAQPEKPLPMDVPEIKKEMTNPSDVWGKNLPPVDGRRSTYEQLVKEEYIQPTEGGYRGTEQQNLDLIDALRRRQSSGELPATRGTYVGDAISQPPSDLGRRYYEIGDEGGGIRDIQKFLNANGYKLASEGPGSPGNETDVFGPRTLQAMEAFQRANGLPADGFIGSQTLRVINTIIAKQRR